MVLNIFLRELFSSRLFLNKGFKRVYNILFMLLWISILVIFLSYTYNLFYDRLSVFANFNRYFLVILIAIFTILIAIYSVKDINRVYFNNKNEKILLTSRPIDIYSILFGKLLYIYLRIFIYTLFTSFLVLLLYGIKLDYSITYYFYSIINTIFLSLFSLSLSLIFSICFRFIFNLIKRNKIILIIFTIIISFSLAIIYAFLLNLFVNLVRNEGINTLFNTTSINNLINLSSNIYLIYNLINFNLNISKLTNLLISLGIIFSLFFISIICFKLYYTFYLKENSNNNKHYLDHQVRLLSPTKALIKKELFLSFNNDDGIFSYLSLILVEPLLIYVVISAIHLIFNTGNLNYIRYLYPNAYLTIDTILIILFISVINSTSSISLEKEKQMLIKIKTLPISPIKQLSIKMFVPYIISSIFYLISLLILVITKEITGLSFLFLLMIGLFILLILNLSSIYTDLKMKNGFISVLLDFILPIFYVMVSFILSLFIDLNESYYYLIIIGCLIITLIGLLINYKKRIEDGFIKHEVSL